MPTAAIPDALVTIKRSFPARPERVFKAWTEAAELRKWFGPAGFETTHAEADARPGGRYRLAIKKQPDGPERCVFGEYREVAAPKKLVFTWSWEHDPEVKDTLVTVEFREAGGGTEVVLTHALLPNETQRQNHTNGWTSTLDRLAAAL